MSAELDRVKTVLHNRYHGEDWFTPVSESNLALWCVAEEIDLDSLEILTNQTDEPVTEHGYLTFYLGGDVFVRGKYR